MWVTLFMVYFSSSNSTLDRKRQADLFSFSVCQWDDQLFSVLLSLFQRLSFSSC